MASFKVSLRSEIRRFSLAERTFAALRDKIQEVFQLASPGRITWRDEDGDMITVAAEEDMGALLSSSSPVRLYIEAVDAVHPVSPAASVLSSAPSIISLPSSARATPVSVARSLDAEPHRTISVVSSIASPSPAPRCASVSSLDHPTPVFTAPTSAISPFSSPSPAPLAAVGSDAPAPAVESITSTPDALVPTTPDNAVFPIETAVVDSVAAETAPIPVPSDPADAPASSPAPAPAPESPSPSASAAEAVPGPVPEVRREGDGDPLQNAGDAIVSFASAAIATSVPVIQALPDAIGMLARQIEALVREHVAPQIERVRQQVRESNSAGRGSRVSAPPARAAANKDGPRWHAYCDSCDQLIVGRRYKCAHCQDYDLCESCEHAGVHAEHTMLRLCDPGVESYGLPPRASCTLFRNGVGRVGRGGPEGRCRWRHEHGARVGAGDAPPAQEAPVPGTDAHPECAAQAQPGCMPMAPAVPMCVAPPCAQAPSQPTCVPVAPAPAAPQPVPLFGAPAPAQPAPTPTSTRSSAYPPPAYTSVVPPATQPQVLRLTRYAQQICQLREMGFTDSSSELERVLAACNGSVQAAVDKLMTA